MAQMSPPIPTEWQRRSGRSSSPPKYEMTRLTTDELKGLPLDWTVAVADGKPVRIHGGTTTSAVEFETIPGSGLYLIYSPSRNFSECGQIIHNKGVSILQMVQNVWKAKIRKA